ncbi:MAG TPA: hypothetical protein VFE85_03610 [Woeseiaceae bacterium]|nr:hypothetical protein [Woeseiaceae bacterium]
MNAPALLLYGLAFLPGIASAAHAVSEQRAWTDTYAVSAAVPRLEVSNIRGSVRVRAGRPGRITVAVTERRSAPDRARFERSLATLTLAVDADASGVSLRVGNRAARGQRSNDCRGCRVDYQFDIEVPPQAELDVGTVLDGKVDIEGVAGSISASNVNGPINLDGVGDCAAINSVNGAISMAFRRPPQQGCRIETINGDIALGVPDGTALDIALDLFNGAVSSEFAVAPFELPATIETIAGDGGTRYRIQQLAGLRIGAGGPLYSITSLNGNLSVRKRQ